jgi:hypothetical protein
VLVKKRIALDFCYSDLLDDHVAIVCKHALFSPLFCRASEAVIAHPARVEVVVPTDPRVAEELLSKRPGFAAKLTLPPGQV